MLTEIEIDCLACGQPTAVSVVVPDPDEASAQRMSLSTCRRCRAALMLVTSPTGELSGCVFDGDLHEITTDHLQPIPSPFDLDEVIRHPVGMSRPRETAVETFRLRPEWAEALDHELRAAQMRPRPLSVPRRIFLSYRWGTPAEDAWVGRLHDELTLRGNIVVFDRDQMRRPEPPSIPRLVADIASCHVFLAVLDPGYLERIARGSDAPQQEGWVTDEFHVASALARAGTLVIVGFLRAGDRIPGTFRVFGDSGPGNTFDVRSDAALASVLDQRFVQRGATPDAAVAERAALALHRSHQALGEQRFDDALAAADGACDLVPELADGWAQRARVQTDAGEHHGALRDAIRAIGIDPDLTDMVRLGAGAAAEVGDWNTCARLARGRLERDGGDDVARFLLGAALEELGHVDAARGHLRLAREAGVRSPGLFVHGGFAAMRAGDPEDAMAWFDDGAELVPAAAAFHKNAVLAAIEAERPSDAYERVERYAAACPNDPELAAVVQELTAWLQRDGPPPRYVPRVDRADVAAVFECDSCGVVIPLRSERSLLCAGCGVVASTPIGSCEVCGSDGRTGSFIGTVCPICDSTGATYRSLA